MKRGNAILAAADARYLAEREAVIVTCRCGFCPWFLNGTVAETRLAYLTHRTAEHPDVQPKARRKRRRHYGQITTGKNLDDNIANARKTGASTWAGAS